MKKFLLKALIVLLAATAIVGGITLREKIYATESDPVGWFQDEDDGDWYYYYEDGRRADGLVNIGGKYYYFSGYTMVHNTFRTINGRRIFFQTDGHAELGTAWGHTDEDWFYFVDGEPQIGWQKIDGKWYYFRDSEYMPGRMIHDQPMRIDNATYWFEHDGSLASTTGWHRFENLWYYAKADGKVAVGWFQVDGKWYYCNFAYAFPTAYEYNYDFGCLRNVWACVKGHWYHFGDDCSMDRDESTLTGAIDVYEGLSVTPMYIYFDAPNTPAEGWRRVNGEWRYFTASLNGCPGMMVRDQYMTIDDRWYRFNLDGSIYTGWRSISGVTFYFTTNGSALGWRYIDGYWYYFSQPSGARAHDGFLWMSNDQIYYFDSQGHMVTGWLEVDGNYYYMSASGVRQAGWQTIGGNTYYFGERGIMATEWTEVDGQWYYFGSSGILKKSCWIQYNGKWVHLDSNGIFATGWTAIDGNWYYFDAAGYMKTGWTEISGKWYYLGTDGIMQTGWIQTGSKWSYCNSAGVAAIGWKQIGGEWYYFDASGYMVTGWKKISNQWYYFGSNGIMQHDTWVGDDHLGSDGAYDYSR